MVKLPSKPDSALTLSFVAELERRLIAPGNRFIQVVMGPRQVGKSTGVQQLLKKWKAGPTLSVTGDGDVARPGSWLEEHWIQARQSGRGTLLVVDEIQKIENWSETVKKLWDEDKKNGGLVRFVGLGSSSLTIQKGLSESLAGRFQVLRVHHWNLAETAALTGMGLEGYLRVGGYPGSYSLAADSREWLEYLRTSIIEAVIGKDILSQARVKSPALFKQCFDLAVSYGAQEISYTKLLGQVQERGNVEIVKHYLELFEGAMLLRQLFKYSAKKVLQRSSSPKILPLCPALYAQTLDLDLGPIERGRSFEICVGAALCRLPGELFYWREGNREVDFVYRFGRKLFAIEAKSGAAQTPAGAAGAGLAAFQKKHPSAQLRIATPENYQKLIEELDAL